MYCFPYPHASSVQPLQVPYLASSVYSLKAQYSFPTFYTPLSPEQLQTYGLKPGHSANLFGLLVSPPSAAIIQSWLFYGLATEALGRDVQHKEFWENGNVDHSQATIDLRIAGWFGSELQARFQRLRKTLGEDEYNLHKKLLRSYCTVTLTVLGLQEFQDEDGTDEACLVLLSVHMLIYLIGSILEDGEFLHASFESKSTRLLVRRMLRNGCCRKRLNFINSSRIAYPTLYFLASIWPQTFGDQSHETCTASTCNVLIPLQEPRHRKEDCLCGQIRVPLEKVLKIVSRGSIPLVRIETLPTGELNLEIIPYIRGIRFIAISHVWADRQFGSTSNSLPRCQLAHLGDLLAGIPPTIDDNGFRDLIPARLAKHMTQPFASQARYFWLDTFCIPQSEEDVDLRLKAIESMNLIYAAAAHTLVLDADLQAFHAGRFPTSLISGTAPTYNAPTNEMLLDTLAMISTSRWMGRAWTLQEGTLSRMVVFQLDGALAFLRLLRPHDTSKMSWSDIVDGVRQLSPEYRDSSKSRRPHDEVVDATTYLRSRIQQELYRYTQTALNVEENRQYARTPAERSTRFVEAYKHLQSRTTTMTKDLPLIITNLSGLNGNYISHAGTAEEMMKLVIYGVGILPVELLFSSSPRLGSCEVDSWIPRDLVPENFREKQVLRLGSDGFHFHQAKPESPFKFCTVPRSVDWSRPFRLHVTWRNEREETRYLVNADGRAASNVKAPEGWCVLVEDKSDDPRAAKFLISRIVGNQVYLHFDCLLRMKNVIDNDKSHASDQAFPMCAARPADSQEEFVIERSMISGDLTLARPQNAEQYSDRLEVTVQALVGILAYFERKFLDLCFGGAFDKNWGFLIIYGIFSYKQRTWVDHAVHEFVHRAWAETFSPDWKPMGAWKWFWIAMNWVPPVPFKTMMKVFCQITFSIYATYGMWMPLLATSLYWFPIFPTNELFGMYIISFGFRFVCWMLGWTGLYR